MKRDTLTALHNILDEIETTKEAEVALDVIFEHPAFRAVADQWVKQKIKKNARKMKRDEAFKVLRELYLSLVADAVKSYTVRARLAEMPALLATGEISDEELAEDVVADVFDPEGRQWLAAVFSPSYTDLFDADNGQAWDMVVAAIIEDMRRELILLVQR